MINIKLVLRFFKWGDVPKKLIQCHLLQSIAHYTIEVWVFCFRVSLFTVKENCSKMKIKRKSNAVRVPPLKKAIKVKRKSSNVEGESTVSKALRNVQKVLEVSCHV